MAGESRSPLSPMKTFPFLVLCVTDLAVLVICARRDPWEGVQSRPASELSLEPGAELEIPCQLNHPILFWYWIPQYPICAGFDQGGTKKIFSTSSVGEDRVRLERFQQRAEKRGEKGNLVLVLKNLHMNDSGTFYCSSDNKNFSAISVSVQLDKENGIDVRTSTTPHQPHTSVTLSCNACKEEEEKSGGNTKMTWIQNGVLVSNDAADFRIIRNSITIKHFSRRHYGLWSCTHPACQNGYCLEGNLENLKSKDDTNPHLQADDVGNAADLRVIGGCVAGVLALLLVGVVAFLICRNRRSHSISETTRMKETGGSKDPEGPEGSSKNKEEAEPGIEDHTYMEVTSNSGAERITYSTLEFREAGGHQTKMDNRTPTVIYSEMSKSNLTNKAG